MIKIVKCFVSIVLLGMFAAQAYGAELFYDSKSWIVNVAGDADVLTDNGLKSKVNVVRINVPQLLNQVPTPEVCLDIENNLNRIGIGKQMIDALTGGGMDDTLLRRLALNNAQLKDKELGAATMRSESGDDLANILADDYLPILMYNYIVLSYTTEKRDSKGNVETYEGRPIYLTYYAIYHVDVDSEQAFDIVSSLTDQSRYNALSYPVSLCSYGLVTGDFEKEIAKEVPALAVRGVLLRRHPARISIGANAGLHKGDLVSIYSQRVNSNGEPYSKRISRARVCGLWDDEAQVNFEANTAGNRKNGDVVVRTPDSHYRVGLMATYMPHVWGGQLLFDSKAGFHRSGLIEHILLNLGFSMTDKPGTSFLRAGDPYNKYKAPMFFNVGLGYGVGKTFLGFFDFTPFFLVQYEGALMTNSKILDSGTDTESSMIVGSAIRVPIGLRFSFNIGYPLKFAVEAGYSLNFGIGDDYKLVKQSCEYLNAKRKGAFVNVGLIF